MQSNLEMIITADGSKTLFLADINEQYHSVNGAMTESKHVFIQHGLQGHIRDSRLTVLEIGFGTGLNALLTAIYAHENQIRIEYKGIEKFPVAPEIISELDYGSLTGKHGPSFYRAIHSCPWHRLVNIHPWFVIFKEQADVIHYLPPEDFNPDIVYFDAFGPDKQPDMWTVNIFEKIFQMMAHNGILVTYSAKGEVRRRLAAAGFEVERLPGPPGKREMLRGFKK